MTLKSASRIARDQAKKDLEVVAQGRSCWDDLNNLYAMKKESILVANAHLLNEVADASLRPYIADPLAFVNAVTVHARDVKTFSDDLEKIAVLHTDRHAPITTDDQIEALRIGEQYEHFHARYLGAVLPNVVLISDAIREAVDRRAAAQAADVNVVTDLQPKEEVPAAQAAEQPTEQTNVSA